MADSSTPSKLVSLFLSFAEGSGCCVGDHREALKLIKACCAQCMMTLGNYPMLSSLNTVWVAISQAEVFPEGNGPPNHTNLAHVSPCTASQTWKPITALRSQPFTVNMRIVLPMVIKLMDELKQYYEYNTAGDEADQQVVNILMDTGLILSAMSATIGNPMEESESDGV